MHNEKIRNIKELTFLAIHVLRTIPYKTQRSTTISPLGQ